MPLTAETGLADVHCSWGGVFVAEAVAALRPAWHVPLSDTDVAPTALFEVRELIRLCELICHNNFQPGSPGLIVGTEPHQDINAGLAIFPGTAASHQPGCLRRKVMAARLHLLERSRAPLPHKPAEPPPTNTLNTEQLRALATAHAEHAQMAALSRTPLAGILEQSAAPGTARSSFEQGALCALAAMSSSLPVPRRWPVRSLPGASCPPPLSSTTTATKTRSMNLTRSLQCPTWRSPSSATAQRPPIGAYMSGRWRLTLQSPASNARPFTGRPKPGQLRAINPQRMYPLAPTRSCRCLRTSPMACLPS